MKGDAFRPAWWVDVSGRDDVLRFCWRIGAVGSRRREAVTAIASRVRRLAANTNRDTVPASVWRSNVVPAMQRAGVSSRSLQAQLDMSYCGTTLFKSGMSRERAQRVARVVRSPELQALATSDVYWDSITSIEADGTEPVYDLTVDELHNFVANDLIVHNSIEQDADVVMFIYRDEYYNKESERLGEADVIVAKHRNGPIGEVALTFLPKYPKFANLYRDRGAEPTPPVVDDGAF